MDTTTRAAFELRCQPLQGILTENARDRQTLLDHRESSAASTVRRTSVIEPVGGEPEPALLIRESPSRYYPPDVAHEHIIFHRLLAMFHSRPFIQSRFPPQGTVAVIRARHGRFLDIHFRFVLSPSSECSEVIHAIHSECMQNSN